MKYKFKLRRSLKKGENHGFWQIYNKATKEYTHYDPNKVHILMRDCKLHNNNSTADKIYEGKENKSVCAWVYFNHFVVIDNGFMDNSYYNLLTYNPRDKPYWYNYEDDVVDKKCYDRLMTLDTNVYVN